MVLSVGQKGTAIIRYAPSAGPANSWLAALPKPPNLIAAEGIQTRRHPRHNAAAFWHLAQEHYPGVAGLAPRSAFDP